MSYKTFNRYRNPGSRSSYIKREAAANGAMIRSDDQSQSMITLVNTILAFFVT